MVAFKSAKKTYNELKAIRLKELRLIVQEKSTFLKKVGIDVSVEGKLADSLVFRIEDDKEIKLYEMMLVMEAQKEENDYWESTYNDEGEDDSGDKCERLDRKSRYYDDNQSEVSDAQSQASHNIGSLGTSKNLSYFANKQNHDKYIQPTVEKLGLNNPTGAVINYFGDNMSSQKSGSSIGTRKISKIGDTCDNLVSIPKAPAQNLHKQSFSDSKAIIELTNPQIKLNQKAGTSFIDNLARKSLMKQFNNNQFADNVNIKNLDSNGGNFSRNNFRVNSHGLNNLTNYTQGNECDFTERNYTEARDRTNGTRNKKKLKNKTAGFMNPTVQNMMRATKHLEEKGMDGCFCVIANPVKKQVVTSQNNGSQETIDGNPKRDSIPLPSKTSRS